MVFRRKELNGGDIDPAINLNGRIAGKKAEPLSNKDIRNREFISLLRKLKPHLASSVKTLMEINEKSPSDQSRLKASALIIQLYKDLIKDVYSVDYDEQEGEEIQPVNKAPVFSLKMISGGKEIDKVEE